MKRLVLSASLIFLFAAQTNADVIKPVDIRATSQFGVGLNLENLINGDSGSAIGYGNFGLVPAGGPGVLDDAHVINTANVEGDPEGTGARGWISGSLDKGIPGGDPGPGAGAFDVSPEEEQIVEFEFDGAYDLTAMHVWNENDEIFAPDRGVDEFELQVNPLKTGGTFTSIGTFNLLADDGFANNFAQVISFAESGVRRVRFLVNSRHGGPSEDYVGLAEVRFEGTLVTQDQRADGNKNGLVDGGDFLFLQRNFGIGEEELEFFSTLSATQSEGDYDNNNVVNADDITVWQAEYGLPPATTANVAAVPEPTTFVLGLLAVLSGLLRHRLAPLGAKN